MKATSSQKPLSTWNNVLSNERCCCAVSAALKLDAAINNESLVTPKRSCEMPQVKKLLQSTGDDRLKLLSTIVNIIDPTVTVPNEPQGLALWYRSKGLLAFDEVDSFIAGSKIDEKDHIEVWMRIFKMAERYLEANEEMCDQFAMQKSLAEYLSTSNSRLDRLVSTFRNNTNEIKSDEELRPPEVFGGDKTLQGLALPEDNNSTDLDATRLKSVLDNARHALSNFSSTVKPTHQGVEVSSRPEQLANLVHDVTNSLATYKSSMELHEKLNRQLQQLNKLAKK